jgi:hypothetical protein
MYIIHVVIRQAWSLRDFILICLFKIMIFGIFKNAHLTDIFLDT